MILTALGATAVAAMVLAYSQEHRSPAWTCAFAIASMFVAVYAALTGAWVFMVLEALWAGIAFRRWRTRTRSVAERQIEHLRVPTSRTPGSLMPSFGSLTDDQLFALAVFLEAS
ncbi:MAG: hypothetical protein ACR2OD_02840 [Gaiellaceae bacterium]